VRELTLVHLSFETADMPISNTGGEGGRFRLSCDSMGDMGVCSRGGVRGDNIGNDFFLFEKALK